jgi:hypothetical protein
MEAAGGLNPLVAAEHDLLFTGRVAGEVDVAEGRGPPPSATAICGLMAGLRASDGGRRCCKDPPLLDAAANLL